MYEIISQMIIDQLKWISESVSRVFTGCINQKYKAGDTLSVVVE